MKFYTFFLFNILVCIVVTITIIDLSRPPVSSVIDSAILDSLQPYYENRTIIQSAAHSAIVHGIILAVSMFIFSGMFKSFVPRTSVHVMYFLVISLPLTFIVSNIIKHMNIFSDLEIYYETINPGLPEMVRMLTTVCLSYTAQKFVLPYL